MNIKINYKRLYLDLIDVSNAKLMNTFNISDTVKIENDFIKGYLNITDYDISNRFTVEYEKCSLGTCNKYNNNIWSASNNVLKLNIGEHDFALKSLNNYLSIEYVTDDIYETNEYETKLLYDDDNTVYFEVPKDIDKAKTIILNINIHNYVYRVILKGDSNAN